MPSPSHHYHEFRKEPDTKLEQIQVDEERQEWDA